MAVQSRYFSVGSVVAWAEPGVGAVATQAMVEVSYGPQGLELMRQGLSAQEAIARLTAIDEFRERRQLGMVGGDGTAASHTGTGCIAAAGHVVGNGYACQANMMLRESVWAAMASAYETTAGDISDRLLASLDAAEGEGGDLRGRQSVALLVVSGDRSHPAWKKELELRVEDHSAPLLEMHRLLALRRAFDRVDQVEDALLKGGDPTVALRQLETYTELHDANIDFTRAIGLAMAGRRDEARGLVQQLAAADPGWQVAAQRYADAGIIPDDPALLDALTPVAQP
ncbi:MAG: DUF1028 domain-containing protein [Candidatus Dormibacteraeota bacterium]|nr:DUF1028 domain-containing protein [Candidatus Dormibacteraeota bacterium]